jgi:hypothetical protein
MQIILAKYLNFQFGTATVIYGSLETKPSKQFRLRRAFMYFGTDKNIQCRVSRQYLCRVANNFFLLIAEM